MTKLETLYASIKGLEKVGLTLTDEMLKKADELEEQLTKTEVLPTLSKDIEPRLSQIQRELVLVVEYKPGEPISVALSRKTNIAEQLEAKRLELDPQVEHKELGPRATKQEKKAPGTELCVYRKDGVLYYKMLPPPLLPLLLKLAPFVFANLVSNTVVSISFRPPKTKSTVMLSVR